VQSEPSSFPPPPTPIPVIKPPRVPLIIGLVALALAASTLGLVLAERYATSSCNATITTTSDGYTELATCTYSDGLVCTIRVVVAGTSENQQQTCS
jgi:hypothetical protein